MNRLHDRDTINELDLSQGLLHGCNGSQLGHGWEREVKRETTQLEMLDVRSKCRRDGENEPASSLHRDGLFRYRKLFRSQSECSSHGGGIL
jgi:hypothetical protein